MFSGPTGTRRKTYVNEGSDEAPVYKNSVLQKHHGITKSNLSHVKGDYRVMLLKILAQLPRFLKLAEAVIDHLKTQSIGSHQENLSKKPHNGTAKATEKNTTQSPRASTFNTFERSQARLHHIPVVDVTALRQK
jgi:hypothetical protein